MKVGGYTLDLYCDNLPDDKRWSDKQHKGTEFPMQYYGQNEWKCLRLARRDGWKIGKRDLCPRCSGKNPID